MNGRDSFISIFELNSKGHQTIDQVFVVPAERSFVLASDLRHFGNCFENVTKSRDHFAGL